MGARLLARVVLTALALLLTGSPARATEDLVGYCRSVGTDDTVRPLPAALVPWFLRAFGLDVPAEVVLHTGSMRCAGGRILACNPGANLPCGRADTRRSIPAANAWCRESRDADVVPAYVTGHASIYAWRCRDGRAEPSRQVAHTDGRGFVAEYWKPLD
jgi:hypothetical protein